MYDTILLPTDGDEGATEALEHALSAADAYGADLHIVSVVDRRVILAADAEDKADVRAELAADAATAVEELATRAKDAGVTATTATPEGVPYREILSYIDTQPIDLLVIGTQGRKGKEKRLNLGSTTERIVKKAEKPVLVVDIG